MVTSYQTLLPATQAEDVLYSIYSLSLDVSFSAFREECFYKPVC